MKIQQNVRIPRDFFFFKNFREGNSSSTDLTSWGGEGTPLPHTVFPSTTSASRCPCLKRTPLGQSWIRHCYMPIQRECIGLHTNTGLPAMKSTMSCRTCAADFLIQHSWSWWAMLANMQLPSRVMLCTCRPAASSRLANVDVVNERSETTNTRTNKQQFSGDVGNYIPSFRFNYLRYSAPWDSGLQEVTQTSLAQFLDFLSGPGA